MTHALHARVDDARTDPVVRVASVPSLHVYVRHLAPPDGEDDGKVVRLPDPAPLVDDTPTGSPWWPPPMLDAEWVDQHLDADLLHVHFGFDHLSPEDLQRLVDSLHRRRVPLVYTVHDLRNPHHRDSSVHDGQLDVLVPAADALITLTDGAAAEIRRRWGRDAAVVPHPHVVPPEVAEQLASRSRPPGPLRVGLHAKSLRASMDPQAMLPALVRAVETYDEHAVLQVDGHTDVLDPTSDRCDHALLALLAELGPHVDVRVHDYFTDDELWRYLAGLDASVLPYRWGTHSGWLEACKDLGTAVVAPTCGYYREQGDVHVFGCDTEHLDEDSLVEAVHHALDRRAAPVSPDHRKAERRAVARAHRQIYRDVLSRG